MLPYIHMKQISFAALLAFALFTSPLVSFAHETRTYLIGGASYDITVGSLNEPVIVGDKTGLDLAISRYGSPLTGAEQGLKVEISSGGATRTFDISAAYGQPGKYKTTFLATATGTLSYRLIGELGGAPVDLLFECSAAGHQMHAVENADRVKVSDGVVRVLQRGAFGCPAPQSDYQFPPVAVGATGATGDAASMWMSGIALALAVATLAVVTLRGTDLKASRALSYVVPCLAVAALAWAVFGAEAPSDGNPEAQASQAHGQGHGAHSMKEVDPDRPVPAISLQTTRDPKDGYNVHLITRNFRFTPESSGGHAANGTGHAHIYVNGVKIGRVYGEWYHLPASTLADGQNVIEVTLNADDHSEWTVRGEHIAAKVVVVK